MAISRQRRELPEIRWCQNNRNFAGFLDFKMFFFIYFLLYLENEKSYRRSASVKTTRFLRALQISAWVTRPERPKGAKEIVKQDRRALSRTALFWLVSTTELSSLHPYPTWKWKTTTLQGLPVSTAVKDVRQQPVPVWKGSKECSGFSKHKFSYKKIFA